MRLYLHNNLEKWGVGFLEETIEMALQNIIDSLLTRLGLTRISVMNTTMESLNEATAAHMGAAKESASRLAGSASEVNFDIGELIEEVESQRVQIDSVATAVNEMAASIQEVAQNTVNASNTATAAKTEVAAAALESTNAMGSIDQLNDEISRASEVIGRVKEESQQINSVLDVIRGIADQTNLLALNAAIEAARAGEQGRGFAVVADEVRTLATRTGDATNEIRSMIEALNSSVEDAVKVMQSASEQANKSEESVEQAAMSLGEIAGQVNTINDMNIQVAAATEEQSAVAEEINRNINTIAHISETVTTTAKQVGESGKNLVHQVSELSRAVTT